MQKCLPGSPGKEKVVRRFLTSEWGPVGLPDNRENDRSASRRPKKLKYACIPKWPSNPGLLSLLNFGSFVDRLRCFVSPLVIFLSRSVAPKMFYSVERPKTRDRLEFLLCLCTLRVYGDPVGFGGLEHSV